MKNLFKNSKRSITAILTLCILLGIAGTCVYAASAVADKTTTVTEGTTQELSPMMATARCNERGATTWGSLDDAKKYYGYNRNYVCTGIEMTGYNSDGTTYQYMQYYYEDSNQNKMYFGVVI